NHTEARRAPGYFSQPSPELVSRPPPKNPMRYMRPSCCARAESGHAAAAPPSSVMKSRRFKPKPPVLPTERIAYLCEAGDCCAAEFRSGLCRVRKTPAPAADVETSQRTPWSRIMLRARCSIRWLENCILYISQLYEFSHMG